MTASFLLHQDEKKRLPDTPTLPESFIPRPHHLNRLKALLTETSSPPTVVLSSRHHVGGMGKTSLALALTQDETIKAAFPDGILWATLGQDPDVLTSLMSWLRVLDDQDLHIPTIRMASEHLHHLIKRRRMLLIVDEVCVLEDLAPFQVVRDTPCRLLVTSRDLVAPGAETYILGEMTVAQSQQFFETQLKRSLGPDHKKEALQFAKAVGYLPLSLHLGALQVKTGLLWSDLIAGLFAGAATRSSEAEKQLRGKPLGGAWALSSFWAFNRHRETQHQARQACLKLCLERLPADLRLRFASLGLFPRNVAITPKMARMIWDVTIPEARRCLLTLKQHGFLNPGPIDGEQGQCYYLHPVMRDMTRWLMALPKNSAMPGLGLSWQAAHQQFLDRYRSLLKDGRWDTVPTDDYIHAHLFWHLEQAGWLGEIHQILQTFNKKGRNAWYDVCDRLGLSAQFHRDLARAWHLAQQVYRDAPEHSIGLQVRYALSASFLREMQLSDSEWHQNTGTGEISGIDINPSPERLLEDRAFTKVLLNAARYLPDLASRIIKSTFYPSVLDQASKGQTIFELLSHIYQYSAEMAVELTDNLRPTPPAIDALRRLSPEYPIFCGPLLQLLPMLTDRAQFVAGVACLAQIQDHRLHPELLTLLPSISHPLDRLMILEQLQARLPTALKQKINSLRQDYLKELKAQPMGIGQLPLTYSPGIEILDVAVADFLELQDYSGWAIALCFEDAEAAPVDQVFEQAMQSRSEEKRSILLAFLVPQLSDHQRQRVWQSCEQFSDPSCKARLLRRLLPYQSESIDRLLDSLKFFENQKKLDLLLQTLPTPLPAVEEKIVTEIFATIAALGHPNIRWDYLIRVIPHLTPQFFPNWLEVMREIPFDPARTCQVLECLTTSQMPIAAGILEIIEHIPPVYERATALQQVTPFLPQDLRSEALEVALRIQFPYARVIALQSFIPDFPDVVQDVMAALESCHPESPDDLYELLIPVLPDAEKFEVITLIAAMPDKQSRLRHLIRALPYHVDLIRDITTLVHHNPDLRSVCNLGVVLEELRQICEADLTLSRSPRTVDLILSMLPLVEWVYCPTTRLVARGSPFCDLLQRYLTYPRHRSLSFSSETISRCLDFFVLIPYEGQRAATLELLMQHVVRDVTPTGWSQWLERLSRYRPHEFHWILSRMLHSLMQFGNINVLHQILQALRAVRKQWNGYGVSKETGTSLKLH